MFSKKIISIDFGTYNTKIVVGRQKKQAVYIDKALMFSTPKNSFYNGHISNIGGLEESIRWNLGKNKIKSNQAVCTMESSSIITREFILPSIKKQELDHMVVYEIKHYLPIALNEYMIEYKVIEEIHEDHMKKARVLVSLLPKIMAQAYYELLSNLNLKPFALDMNSNAISKLFTQGLVINDKKFNFKKTAAVIDLGHNHINISIISKGIHQFSRIIPMESRSIYHNPSSPPVLSKKINHDQNDWVFQAQKLFLYYNSRSFDNKIDQIYFYGGRSKLKGLDLYLSNTFNIPSIKINTMNFIQIPKNCGFTLEDYLNGAGAIIRR